MATGMTGTQYGLTTAQFDAAVELVSSLTGDFHHGDCIGADLSLAEIATELKLNVIAHPPEKSDKRAFHKSHAILDPLPYLERDYKIVDAVDLMFAFPKGFNEERRSGTWTTIRYARKRKKPLVIVWPDGTMTSENM